jgi:hypothetical protein
MNHQMTRPKENFRSNGVRQKRCVKMLVSIEAGKAKIIIGLFQYSPNYFSSSPAKVMFGPLEFSYGNFTPLVECHTHALYVYFCNTIMIDMIWLF